MKIWRITYCVRELPLRKPIYTAAGNITARKVIYIALHGEEGIVGIGEAAPLPEFGSESIEDVLDAVKPLAARTDFPDLSGTPRDIAEWIIKVGVSLSGMRLLVFALNCALLSLRLQYDRRTPGEFFQHSVVDSVNVNALISGANAEQVLEAAEAAVRDGFGTLKIKVGMSRVEEDVELMNAIRKRYPSVKLRADANRAWSYDDAVAFFTGVSQAQLEYVEDPLRDPSINPYYSLLKRNLIPIAFDSTISSRIPLSQAINDKICHVLVIKPSVMGSWLWLKSAADQAAAAGKSIVISSLLESEVGLAYLVHCAALFGSGAYAHGLATASYLMGGSLTPPLRICDGKIEIPQLSDLHKRISSNLQADLEILSL